jgi:hypothetical protein
MEPHTIDCKFKDIADKLPLLRTSSKYYWVKKTYDGDSVCILTTKLTRPSIKCKNPAVSPISNIQAPIVYKIYPQNSVKANIVVIYTKNFIMFPSYYVPYENFEAKYFDLKVKLEISLKTLVAQDTNYGYYLWLKRGAAKLVKPYKKYQSIKIINDYIDFEISDADYEHGGCSSNEDDNSIVKEIIGYIVSDKGKLPLYK